MMATQNSADEKNLEQFFKALKEHFHSDYREWAERNVLWAFNDLTPAQFEAAIEQMPAWMETLKAPWQQEAAGRALDRLKDARKLIAGTRQLKGTPEALGEQLLEAFERYRELTESRDHSSDVGMDMQLLIDQSSATRLAMIDLLLERMDAIKNRDQGQYGSSQYLFEYTYKKLLGSLMKNEQPLPDALADRVFDWAGNYDEMYAGNEAFFPQLVRLVETRLAQRRAIPDKLLAMLRRTNITNSRYSASGLQPLLDDLPEPVVNPGEAWSDRALSDLEALPEAQHLAWKSVFKHACSKASKPNAAWEKPAQGLIKTIGAEAFSARVLSWLALIGKPRTQRLESAPFARADANVLFDNFNTRVARGLAWFVGLLPASDDAARVMAHLTETSLKKIPGVGPRDPMLANAGVFALGRMNSNFAVGQLARLKSRVTFKTTLKEIEKALDAAAERAGLSRNDLEELSVPTFGLESDGTRTETLGEVIATLRVTGNDVALEWRDARGKLLKNPPTSVKKDFAEDLKELKTAVKDIEGMLSAQSVRLDRLNLEQKTWVFEAWRERYLDHPLVGGPARRLIWTVNGTPVMWNAQENVLQTVSDESINTVQDGVVALWHPINSSQSEVLAWRQRLETHQITQPWKQAYREVYLLTDAERRTHTYSNRFAAHIIKQHQFAQLAAYRGWKNKLRLMVDDTYPPAMLELPRWNLRAEFWIEGVGDNYGVDTNDAGSYLRLSTDQVRFYPLNAPENHAHAGGGGYEMWLQNGRDPVHPIPLEEIPPLVLSEVMRDVDLFVGVSSVGNDPTWNDGGPQGRFRDYWNSYSFGELNETAQTRKAVLEKLVPRLKIRGRASLEGKFLRVQGDLRTYKIHLGSGNILMEPNDQYLCIVPNSSMEGRSEGVFLPFEGDRTLAIILSKAFLLAEDTKITDSTITRQIKS
jgi:hypothetical protein